MTKILAFSGRKQSGKSTGSEYMQALMLENNLSSKIYSFADPLKKDICMNMLGLSYNQCYGSDEDKNTLTSIRWENIPGYNISWTYSSDYHESGFMTARQVMEVIGTDIFRSIKHSVWVDATINKIKDETPDVAIISDCRFPNEVDSILDNNGLVIRLTLDSFHAFSNSESALDQNNYDWNKFSLIIDNTNLNIEDKNKQIKDFLLSKGILPL
jgi:hypothetical protein